MTTLAWEDADHDGEPLDEHATALCVEHGYWSLTHDEDGWMVELVVQDAELAVRGYVPLGNFWTADEAKAQAERYDAGGHRRVNLDVHHLTL